MSEGETTIDSDHYCQHKQFHHLILEYFGGWETVVVISIDLF